MEKSRYYSNPMEHRHNQQEAQENDTIHAQENENWKRKVEME